MTDLLTEKNSDELILVANRAIRARMIIGSVKHPAGSWRRESVRLHVLKSIRHLRTAPQILEGNRPADNECHLSAGITRAAMSLGVANQPTGGIDR